MARYAVIEQYTVEDIFIVEGDSFAEVSEKWDTIVAEGLGSLYYVDERRGDLESTFIEPLD